MPTFNFTAAPSPGTKNIVKAVRKVGKTVGAVDTGGKAGGALSLGSQQPNCPVKRGPPSPVSDDADDDDDEDDDDDSPPG